MCMRMLVAVLGLALAGPMQAQENAGAQAYEKIRSLAGDREGSFECSGARTDKGKMDAGYYLPGNGSAVVENLLQDGKPMMTTVYHLDGPNLRLTHYCAAQNQPWLKAQRIDLAHNAVDFAFVDVTKMRSPDAPHVRGLEWRMVDADHVKLTFLFEAGSKQSRETIQLRRVARKNDAGK
jgi:hypothetical protein